MSLGAIAVGTSLLAGCGDGTDGGSAASGPPKHALIAAFPQGEPYIPAGVPSRLPYLISDTEGVPLSKIAGPVTFTVSRDRRRLGTVEVAPHSDGVPRAYLPVTFEFPSPGIYDLAATYDGATLDSTVNVVDLSKIGVPIVGQPLPPVDSPTVADPMGVDPLCSRQPACPYHATDLRDALGIGRPVVLVVATPAYCQTAVCGPLLDLVLEQTAGRADLTVVHSEVYKDPRTQPDLAKAALAPVPEAYQLQFEPVVFVTDRTGTVVARADITVDRSELREMLKLAV